MRKIPAFLFIFTAAFLLSGCVLRDASGNLIADNDTLKSKDVTIGLSADKVCNEAGGPLSCKCMFCENKTSWIPALIPFLQPYFDSTLYKGECRLEDCNAEIFMSKASTSGYYYSYNVRPRFFMFGTGPNFISNDRANLYCEYTLQLATKWIGTYDNPPRIPSENRAACWLERDTIPIYIYNTGGTAIDPQRTLEIASMFDANDTGPVMLTTELGLNSTNASQIAAVKSQILALDNCTSCITVLAVQPWDTKALDEIFGDNQVYPDHNYHTLGEMVDAVGFGFRANDYQTCNINRILYSNLDFSRLILENYSKPTIWLYAGISEGKNVDGTCDFSPANAHNFYQSIFGLSQALASSGIIGVSFYEFVDGTGPLQCNGVQGCEFGVIKGDGMQKHPEMNSWSSLCQFYGTAGARPPIVYSKNGKGSTCDFSIDAKMYTFLSSELNSQLGLNNSVVLPIARKEKLNCGEACVSYVSLSRPEIYDELPASFSSGNCEVYPEIEDMADEADISAVYFRSLLQQESEFDPMAVSCVDWSSDNCNTNNYTMAEICLMSGLPSDCKEECSYGQKPCAFGLAQCIALPGDSAMTSLCGGFFSSYNPFNPSHSICCGINEFKTHLASIKDFLDNNWQQLSACQEGMTQGEYGWAQYYLAANRYYGAPTTGYRDSSGNYHDILPMFISQRDASGPCTGEQHYIRYLRNNFVHESIPGFRDSEYGAKQLSVYLKAIDACDSDCPGALPGPILPPGQTGSMRAFGHSLAVGTFSTHEQQISQSLSNSGVSATLEPTIASIGSSVAWTTEKVNLAGHHNAIVLYTGVNDDLSQTGAMQAKFNTLLAAAAAKADKVYVFNIIEYGSPQNINNIISFNAYLDSYAANSNGKVVLLDINSEMELLGCPGWHATSIDPVHSCYQETRDFFVEQVAANPPPVQTPS